MQKDGEEGRKSSRRPSLAQQVRSRRAIDTVDRKDSSAAPGLSGAYNVGPGWVTENATKLVLAVLAIIVMGSIVLFATVGA